MRILSVEIEGFQSYGTRQSMERLDPHFNAVTGLNGSGKSNVLNAIRFVLGVPESRHLHATDAGELIFNRGQSGVIKTAVCITFDNTDPHNQAAGYENEKEIVVKKELCLDGRATYHVNGKRMSSKRLTSFFTSCSLNVNNPHSVLMQDGETKLLDMTPKELLQVVRKAAGLRFYAIDKQKQTNKARADFGMMPPENCFKLVNVCTQISRVFGNIFCTLVPGGQCRLEFVDANDITSGLLIRLSCNGGWNDGLDELSPRERSLVDLSLLLAVVKCNKTPICLLDDLDVGLDESCAANITRMIRQDFPDTQFIVAALKKSTWNDANVVYRTHFVNGRYFIRRI